MILTRRTLMSLPIVLPLVNLAARAGVNEAAYFPPPDAQGGWRTGDQGSPPGTVGGLEKSLLDDAFDYVRTSSRHGGLLVLSHGWLVYERYFGRASREAHPNMHSIAKMFTSVSCGILVAEHVARFPDGLAQKVFTKEFLPEAFPLDDERMADIRMGNLLTMTSGISRANYIPGASRVSSPGGHSTGIVQGENVEVPSWCSGDSIYDLFKNQDSSAVHGRMWTAPGEGYLYGRDPHVASMILRRVAGRELQEFIDQRLARPMGFGAWGYAVHGAKGDLPHTPGETGIALCATDILRFGYLLLKQGMWKSEQLVPSRYVELLSRPSPFNPHCPFSLMFEVNADGHVPRAPRDAYFKSGAGGCALYVIPSMDMVIYKMAEADDPDETGLLPANSHDLDTSRDGWKPHPYNQFTDGPVDGDTGVRRTLELVCSARPERSHAC
jgi:CubicO group peptidase (beta-lactamase class C family)